MSKKKSTYHHGNLREILLETVVGMIADKGLESVSMRTLGKRIGVSRTAPYRHFTNKNDLLCAIAVQGFKRLRVYLKDAQNEPCADSVDSLGRVGTAYIRFAIENPVHYRLMFGHSIPNQDRTSQVMEAGAAAFEELVGLVKRCMDENLVKPSDPFIIANMCWAMTHGVSALIIDGTFRTAESMLGKPGALLKGNGEADIDIQRISEYLLDALFNGILVNAPKEKQL